MSIKIAINGFGRIGRLAFRQMFGQEDFDIVAINDLTGAADLAYLLKYDTAQGRYDGHTVENTDHSIIVDGKEIEIYAIKDANECPWKELNVDVVIECTGFYVSKEKSMAHINAGAKKVIISAPAKGVDMTVVYNVNHTKLTGEEQIIIAKEFVKIGKENNMIIHGCCENPSLKEFGVDITGCMSQEIVEKAIGFKLNAPSRQSKEQMVLIKCVIA